VYNAGLPTTFNNQTKSLVYFTVSATEMRNIDLHSATMHVYVDNMPDDAAMTCEVYESDEYQQVSNHNFQLLITSSHTVRQ
jgi:hypothetical protein